MGNKSEPFPEYNDWTTSRYWGFVRSALRKAWVKWPPRFNVIKESRRAVKNKRHKWEVRCAVCKKWWQLKHIQVDHIEPVGTLKKYEHLPDFVRKLFVSSDKLRTVCKGCHQIISKKNRNVT